MRCFQSPMAVDDRLGEEGHTYYSPCCTIFKSLCYDLVDSKCNVAHTFLLRVIHSQIPGIGSTHHCYRTDSETEARLAFASCLPYHLPALSTASILHTYPTLSSLCLFS